MNIDQMVDSIVEVVNYGYREPMPENEVPQALRQADIDGYFDWRIAPINPAEGAPWIDDLEARLEVPLPPSFRSLVTRYEFPSFELGIVHLFANTSQGTARELRTMAFADTALAELLKENRIIPFGQMFGGHSNLVCFDGRSVEDGEYPVVHLDWQAATQGELRIVTELAASFASMLVGLLAAGPGEA